MPKPKTDDYTNFVDLQSVFAEATSRLATLQADIQAKTLEIIDEHKKEYADLQEAISQAESAIEDLAAANPSWFGNAKSVKTPYAVVKFHASEKLAVANEEASIILIEKDDNKEAAKQFIRQKKSLNLEALEKLTDEQLEAYRIVRVPVENFSIKATTIDLGKAVAQTEKEVA